MKQETINTLRQRTTTLLDLLDEASRALAYEACRYHLIAHPPMSSNPEDHSYALYDISTRSEVVSGRAEQIRSWCRRRGVDAGMIYDAELLTW